MEYRVDLVSKDHVYHAIPSRSKPQIFLTRSFQNRKTVKFHGVVFLTLHLKEGMMLPLLKLSFACSNSVPYMTFMILYEKF